MSQPWETLKLLKATIHCGTPVGYVTQEKDVYLRKEVEIALSALRDNANELEGIRRFLRGEQLGVSTGICESITYGYGDLDVNGYWQYPVPPALVALKDRAERAEAELEQWERGAKDAKNHTATSLQVEVYGLRVALERAEAEKEQDGEKHRGEMAELHASYEAVCRERNALRSSLTEREAELARLHAEIKAKGYDHDVVSAPEYFALEAEHHALREQINEWIKANGPGGWINDLREQVANAQAVLRSIEFALPQQKCPACLGWDGGPKGRGETPLRHTKDCPLVAALQSSTRWTAEELEAVKTRARERAAAFNIRHSPDCFAGHPTIAGLMCELKKGHDGPHRCTVHNEEWNDAG